MRGYPHNKDNRMRLKDLMEKYDNSGLNGNPAITDAELKELEAKLAEMEEFLQYKNPTRFGVILDRNAVQNTIWNRQNL